MSSPEIFGSVTMYEQPSSPSVSFDRIEYTFKGAAPCGEAAYNALVDRAANRIMFRGNTLNISACSWSHDIKLDTLKIVTFANGSDLSASGNNNKEEGKTEYSFDRNEQMLPIENHAKYFPSWNNRLYVRIDKSKMQTIGDHPQDIPPLPVYIATKTQKTFDLEDQRSFAWGKTPPPDQTETISGVTTEYSWFKYPNYPDMLHPGLENYPYDAPIITETRYFKSLDAAEAALPKVNSHAAPGKTFGYSSDPVHWIVKPLPVEHSSTMYLTKVQYHYADEWNTEIYP